jgi:hypothetical protein
VTLTEYVDCAVAGSTHVSTARDRMLAIIRIFASGAAIPAAQTSTKYRG